MREKPKIFAGSGTGHECPVFWHGAVPFLRQVNMAGNLLF
jgi:hypothetical protein